MPWLARVSARRLDKPSYPLPDTDTRNQLAELGFAYLVAHVPWIRGRGPEWLPTFEESFGAGLKLKDKTIVFGLNDEAHEEMWDRAFTILDRNEIRSRQPKRQKPKTRHRPRRRP